ncbi:hypothetical protein VTL71DRAFT_5189 [Oculimacula yallundae]|uniref:BTB domain-containing protein n=1 Tax=Oculimacula yallundae TaxID=86028 RepID=A0ABR4C0E3_9HELO
MSTAISLSKSAKQTKLPRFSVSSSLKVLAGPYAETFYINKELICAASKFFETMCEDSPQDGHRRTITLIDIDAEAFAIFSIWLTTGNLSISSVPLSIEAELESAEKHFALWQQLGCCYNLGDRLLRPRFKNAIMDALVNLSKILVMDYNTFPIQTAEELEIVYKTTKPGSELRMLIVDLTIGCLGLKSLEGLDRGQPHLDAFCMEVLGRTYDLLSDHQGGGWREGCYLEYPWECLGTRYHGLEEEA